MATVGGYATPLTHSSLITHPDQKVLDMRDKIYYLNPSSTPLLTILNKLGKEPCRNTTFKWMEDEYYTMFAGKCKVAQISGETVKFNNITYDHVKLTLSRAIERQAFEESKTLVTPTTGAFDTTNAFSVIVNGKTGYVFSPNLKAEIDAAVAGGATNTTYTCPSFTDGQVISHKNEVHILVATADTAAFVLGGANYLSFETKSESMSHDGWAEGSGLGGETTKRVRFMENCTQIFKTSYSVTNTAKEVQLYGGGTEYDRIRARKAAEHKLAIEKALLFNGAAAGQTTTTRKTRGLGIGKTDGFIETKNAAASTDFQWNWDLDPDPQVNLFNLYDIFENVLEDSSENPIMMISQKWRTILHKLIQQQDNSSFIITENQQLYGMSFDTLRTPSGDVKMVWNPNLRGPYEDYGLILNMNRMTLRPLGNRDTKLFMDVASQEIDGQVDYYLTELGLEVQAEHENAVIKLV